MLCYTLIPLKTPGLNIEFVKWTEVVRKCPEEYSVYIINWLFGGYAL